MKRGLSAISHKYHSHHQSHERINEDSDSNSLMITFGVPLSTDGQIVLLQLITHIHTYSTTVGIFRKSGNKCRIEKMIRDLGERPLSEIISSGKYNPHDFASVLKQYFAELPEPILMKRHLDAYLQASGIQYSILILDHNLCHIVTVFSWKPFLAFQISHLSLQSPALSNY